MFSTLPTIQTSRLILRPWRDEDLLPFAESHGVVLIMENHFKDNYWDYPEFAQRMAIFCEIVSASSVRLIRD